jgi:hypothetical protein
MVMIVSGKLVKSIKVYYLLCLRREEKDELLYLAHSTHIRGITTPPKSFSPTNDSMRSHNRG